MSDDQDTATPTYSVLEATLPATTLTKLTTFGDATRTGKVLRVKVEAVNQMGSVQSPALQFVLASVPAKPTPPPAVDMTGTTTSAIKVNFANANADTGGSAILGYELEMDDGNQGVFRNIFNSS